MPAHEPEILQGRAERIIEVLVGLNVSEQLSLLGALAGRLAATTLPKHLQPEAFELIGRAVQVGVQTAPRSGWTFWRASPRLAGWLVNNLYQVHSGAWVANLRRPEAPGQEFGRGATPEAALSDCIAKMGGLPAPDDDLDAMLG